MERLTNKGTKEAKPDVTIREVLDKLAEYEDFEEIFRSKMTDSVCEFLTDKEEFAKWIDRNKWVAKKCDEYARSEEQGRLLNPKCVPGDYVWEINKERNIISEYEVASIRYVINKAFHYMWTLRDGIYGNLEGFWDKDIGKTVFLMREEAEAALKEL